MLGLDVWKRSGKKMKRKEDDTREKKRSEVRKRGEERGEERISMVHGKEFETSLSLGKQLMCSIADLGEQQSL